MSTSTTPLTPFLESFLTASLPIHQSSLEKIFTSGDIFGKKEMQISWLQASFLQMLVKISGAQNILEIGTYVGFSASVLATATPQIKSVTTCEILPEYHKKASENIIEYGLSNIITPLLGDAKEIITNSQLIEKKVDILFLDGDKENYGYYLDIAISILPPGGLFIADNTLFKGELIGGNSNYSVGIRKLLEDIKQHPSFDISHVTIGDGMLIARRKG